MKKLFFAIVTLAMALYSCGGGSENKGSDNVDSKAEANQIIAYTNDVIDYLNGSGDWMRSNESRITDMLKAIETKRKPQVLLPLLPNTSFNIKSDKLNVTTAPSVMSKEEKTLFEESMAAYIVAYKSMTSKCFELNKYIRNEDYKDDDYATGKQLADSIKIQYSYLNETKSMLYGKIDIVSEKAENIILQDHPLKDPIFALKGELKNFTELYNAFYAYSEKTMTADQVDQVYQRVSESVEKNKSSFESLLEENKVKSRYESFYKRSDDALAAYRKALRLVKSNSSVPERDFKHFSSNYNSLIGAYNSFVN